ncbi:hypothetical protein PA598K_05229 [Paenibacillus sp. 598K]|uniref:ABC transporter substrate-binding protein n=1 Tax=Paenibacillus sp. 598K TaxID=1117987 RepID=UPI000FF9593C|nr:ABC transporter substrate-binding protein [Paenibacillus sp. 598K]GBF76743.1 hypothetical protein PA598K_05229 [Paenibacillus sp. 598K]
MHLPSIPWIRQRTVGLLSLVIVCLLTACGGASPAAQSGASSPEAAAPSGANAPAEIAPSNTEEPAAPAPRIVTDEMGHEVELPAEPSRIFAPYMEDSLLSLGMKPVAQWATGASGQAYLQEWLHDVPTVDFTGGLPPAPEAVMSFDPDLIILHNVHYANNGVYEAYSKIAPVYVFENAAGDLKQSIRKLGELLDKQDEAEAALQAYEQKKEDARAKLAPVVTGKNAALINFNHKGFYMIGGNYFGGYVLAQELGIGKSPLVSEGNSFDISLEALPDLDADFIFTINYGGTGTANMAALMDNGIWRSLPAVKNDQVYEVSDAYWTGSGLIAYGKIIDDVVELLVP